MTRTFNIPSNPAECLAAEFNHFPGVIGQAVELALCARFPEGQPLIGQLGGMNVYREFGKGEGGLIDKERTEALGKMLSLLCVGCTDGYIEPSFGMTVAGSYVS